MSKEKKMNALITDQTKLWTQSNTVTILIGLICMLLDAWATPTADTWTSWKSGDLVTLLLWGDKTNPLYVAHICGVWTLLCGLSTGNNAFLLKQIYFTFKFQCSFIFLNVFFTQDVNDSYVRTRGTLSSFDHRFLEGHCKPNPLTDFPKLN